MKAKKYTELYNDVWLALHKRDKFVVTSDKTHEELVAYLADKMQAACRAEGFISWPDLAEACIDALVCQDGA